MFKRIKDFPNYLVCDDGIVKRGGRNMIKSISYSQDEILNWIIQLYCPVGFELDPTYSKGCFYKNIPKPQLRFDLNPQIEGVEQSDCCNLPLNNESINTMIFDPPFVAGKGNTTNGIIRARFGSYKTTQNHLWPMYHAALTEFYRILKQNGILVVKCQDCIDSAKQYMSHIEIINKAAALGFYPKDLFILLAKHRICLLYTSPSPRDRTRSRMPSSA